MSKYASLVRRPSSLGGKHATGSALHLKGSPSTVGHLKGQLYMQVLERLYERHAVRPPNPPAVPHGPLSWLPCNAREPSVPLAVVKSSDSAAISLSKALSPICQGDAAPLHRVCSFTEPLAVNAWGRHDQSQLRNMQATTGMLLVGALAILVLKVRIPKSFFPF